MNEALIEGERIVGGLKLRPWTSGSKIYAAKMGLKIFTGTTEGLSESEIEWEIFAFAWMHNAPLDQVISSVRNNTFREKVDAFIFSIDITMLPKLCEEINRISELVKKQALEVIPRPGSEDKDAPPN